MGVFQAKTMIIIIQEKDQNTKRTKTWPLNKRMGDKTK